MGFGKRLRDSQTFGINAAAIAANGYAPLPIWPGQKKPSVRREWQNYRFKEDDLATYAAHGIGILTRNTPAVDIDVRDARIARKLDRLVTRTLGVAPERIGLPPKSLRVYRLSGKPFGKLATGDYHLPGDAPGAKAHKVEILADGQQFVAYSNHKDTGKPYNWNGDGNPLITSVQDLPPITEQQAKALIAAADRLLAKYGTPVSERAQSDDDGPRESNENLKADDPQQLRAALAHIKNDDLAYDDWINVGLAIKGALGADGEQDFAKWSALSEKNDPDATAKAWKSFKPDRIGAGTIVHLAKEAGWIRPPPDEAPEMLTLDDMLGRFVHITKGPQIVDLNNTQRSFWTPEFHAAYAHCRKPNDDGKKIPITQIWCKSPKRKTADVRTFNPAHGQFFEENGLRHFNTWIAPNWPVTDTALAAPFFEHLEDLIPDECDREALIDWLAHAVQKPRPGTIVTDLVSPWHRK